jgi:hypothetical protein
MVKAFGIRLRVVQPPRETHCLRDIMRCNDPYCAEKVLEVPDLYIDSPAHAMVISIDNNSEIHFVDGTQLGL